MKRSKTSSVTSLRLRWCSATIWVRICTANWSMKFDNQKSIRKTMKCICVNLGVLSHHPSQDLRSENTYDKHI